MIKSILFRMWCHMVVPAGTAAGSVWWYQGCMPRRSQNWRLFLGGEENAERNRRPLWVTTTAGKSASKTSCHTQNAKFNFIKFNQIRLIFILYE